MKRKIANLVGLMALWACVCISLMYVYQSVVRGIIPYDFQYNPVRILVNGENPYLYSLNHIKFENWQVDANQVPSCLALLLPFAMFDRETANLVWTCCNIAFSLMFLFYLYKIFLEPIKAPRWVVVFLSFVLFAGQPWRNLVGNGQHLMFSLAFFLAAYYEAERGRSMWAGVLLALSGFKYTTIAPMALVFLYRRQWITIAVATAIHLGLTIGVAIWLWEDPIVLIRQSFEVSSNLTGAGCADIISCISRLGIAVDKSWVYGSYALYGLAALLPLTIKRGDPFIKMGYWAILSCVMFYHRFYDFVALLIPAMVTIIFIYKNLTISKAAVLPLAALVVFFWPAKTLFFLEDGGYNQCVFWCAVLHAGMIVLLAMDFYSSSNQKRMKPCPLYPAPTSEVKVEIKL